MAYNDDQLDYWSFAYQAGGYIPAFAFLLIRLSPTPSII